MKTQLQHLMCGLLLCALVLFVGTGCKNTAKGFGKDMENTGEKIQDKVD